MAPVLRIENLSVEIKQRKSAIYPVNDVSLEINAGEIIGVVGESGAGKSMMGNAVIGLLDPPARISNGSVYLGDQDISALDSEEMLKNRGKRIGMVFQDPLTSLNPLLRVGDQLTETIMTHLDVSAKEAEKRALEALIEVGIPAAEARMDHYPHQFSGGMRQRVVIALALCAEPELVIADEPTTALDVSVQAQILAVLKDLCRSRGTAIMMVTHDMGVIAETVDKVAVMYAGKLVEFGAVEDVIANPMHPYTIGLMASTPMVARGMDRLKHIPGNMPRPGQIPSGCAFHPRCNRADDQCKSGSAPNLEAGKGRAACWHIEHEVSA